MIRNYKIKIVRVEVRKTFDDPEPREVEYFKQFVDTASEGLQRCKELNNGLKDVKYEGTKYPYYCCYEVDLQGKVR